MTTLTDSQLLEFKDRLKDAVVIITGGANGIGRENALECAKYGAKIVIGDRDEESGKAVVASIIASGGNATFRRCDVLIWDDLVALFKTSISTYGTINVVVANAGITEGTPNFGTINLVKNKHDGELEPSKPSLQTVQVNLNSVMYTAHLALHYMTVEKPVDSDKTPNKLKTFVFIGSIASIGPIPFASCYTAAKHGVLGFMTSFASDFRLKQIRVGIICPFFADTAIVTTPAKLFLAGIPKVPIPRISRAIVHCATSTDLSENEGMWMLPDGDEVFLIRKTQRELSEGVYKMINDRVEMGFHYASKLQYAAATVGDVAKLFLGQKTILVLAAGSVAVAAIAGQRYLAAEMSPFQL